MLESPMSQLKQQVYELLLATSPEKATQFNLRFVHPNRKNHTERLWVADLNVFWRMELTKLSVDTIPAREALYDNISGLEWLELFAKYVLPVVLEHWGTGPEQ